MAIYHFHMKTLSRSDGHSATAGAAYQSCTRIIDETTGVVHNYSKRKETVYAGIETPGNAPEWTKNRAKLWNMVEKSEKRVDARLARSFDAALPLGLSPKEAQELVKKFSKHFTDKGMVLDWAIHDINGKNPHVHGKLTDRTLQGDGFGHKDRSWNGKDLIWTSRKVWEVEVNQVLRAKGRNERISCESYETQGIDKPATRHRGVAVAAMAKRDPGIKIEKDLTPRHWKKQKFTQEEVLEVRKIDKEIQGLEIERPAIAQDATHAEKRIQENKKYAMEAAKSRKMSLEEWIATNNKDPREYGLAEPAGGEIPKKEEVAQERRNIHWER